MILTPVKALRISYRSLDTVGVNEFRGHPLGRLDTRARAETAPRPANLVVRMEVHAELTTKVHVPIKARDQV
jgi:hypothetical protein